MPDASTTSLPSPAEGSLAAAIATPRATENRLAFHDILRHFVAACREVARSHSNGRRHLALTPNSIRLGEYGVVDIIGWREAPPPVDSEDGTIAFRAPELLDGTHPKHPVDERTDVYGLGTVLYVCLTGRPPFEGQTREEIVARIREGLPWPPSSVARSVPSPLEAVCLKALEREPSDRYACPLELARDVERWMAGDAVLAEGPPSRFRFLDAARRQPSLVLIVGLMILTVLGLLVGMKFAWNQRQQLRLSLDNNAQLQVQLAEASAAVQRTEGLVRQGRQQAVQSAEARHQALQAMRSLLLLASPRPEDPAPLAEMKQALISRTGAATQQIAALVDAATGNDPAAVIDHLLLGELFLTLGQPNEAQRRAEKGLSLARTLAAGQPEGHPIHRDVLGGARLLGQAHVGLGQAAAAREAFHEAVTVAEKLTRAHPENPDARRNLLTCLELLGGAARLQGDFADARRTHEKLLATVETYAKDNKDPVTPRASLVAARFALGEIERLDHRPEEALKHYSVAAKLLESLTSEGRLKDLPQGQAQRNAVNQRIQEMQSILQAVANLDYALSQPPETVGQLLLTRALVLIRRGQPQDAIATLDHLCKARPHDPVALYNAACGFALCAAVDRAFDTLRASIVNGWTNAAHTEADRDWTALRDDPRFTQLLNVMRLRQAWLTFPTLP